MYHEKIPEDSPYHFNQRWGAIVDLFKRENPDVITLQEVHEGFLGQIEVFANDCGYDVASVMYNKYRQCYLVTLSKTGSRSCYSVVHVDGSYTKALAVYFESLVVMNIHLPLDRQNLGERVHATSVIAQFVATHDRAVMIGDWNTLPDCRGWEQLGVAEENGLKVVYWKNCNTTFWGFPHEPENLREFNSPAILDRAAVKNVNISSAECLPEFISDRCAISDHFPCKIDIDGKPVYSSRLTEVLENKRQSQEQVHESVITPEVWCYFDSTILEARFHGLPIRTLCDTSDKRVITYQHLGYDYRYYPFEESWGECPLVIPEEKTKVEINRELWEIGKELSRYHKVWFVQVMLNCKGYILRLGRDEISENSTYSDEEDDCVLFVFDLDLTGSSEV